MPIHEFIEHVNRFFQLLVHHFLLNLNQVDKHVIQFQYFYGNIQYFIVGNIINTKIKICYVILCKNYTHEKKNIYIYEKKIIY